MNAAERPRFTARAEGVVTYLDVSIRVLSRALCRKRIVRHYSFGKYR